MLQNQVMVFFGVNPWDSLVQRPQHLARGFSRHNQVVYVDPTAFSVFTRLALSLQGDLSTRGWLPRLRHLTDSLHVLTPPPLFPLSLWSNGTNRLNARAASHLLARVLKRLGLRAGILWTSSPQHHLFPELVPADLVCYDCLDNFPAFYPGRRARLLAEQERDLLGKAQVTFVTDPSLESKCRSRCQRVHLLPNAVAPQFLNGRTLPCPAQISSLPRPVIGCAGTFSHWVDLSLLRSLAAARPAWSFVMVGPCAGLAAPSGPPNLHFPGEKRHDDLPAWLDAMDVCLIPFIPGELTRSVNPVKLYEYLARGKPVVAADTQALRPFAKFCALATGPEGFLTAIEAALAESGRAKIRRRQRGMRFAADNTWEHRLREAGGILAELLRRQRTAGQATSARPGANPPQTAGHAFRGGKHPGTPPQ